MSKTNTKALEKRDNYTQFIKRIDVVLIENDTDYNRRTETKFTINPSSEDVEQDVFDTFVNNNILKPNLGTKVVTFECTNPRGWVRHHKEVEHNGQQEAFMYLLNNSITDILNGEEKKHQKRLAIYNYAKDLEIKDKREYGYPERYNGKLTKDELYWSHYEEKYHTIKLEMSSVLDYKENREALLVNAKELQSSFYNRVGTSVEMTIKLGYNNSSRDEDGKDVFDFKVNSSELKLRWKDSSGEERTKDLTGGEVIWNKSRDGVKQVKYCGQTFTDNSRSVSFNTYIIYMREKLYNDDQSKKAKILQDANLLRNVNKLYDLYPEAEVVEQSMWKTDIKKLTHKSARGIEKCNYSRGYYGSKNYKVVFDSGSYLVYERSQMEIAGPITNAYLGAFDVEWIAPDLMNEEAMSNRFLQQIANETRRKEECGDE